LRNNCSNLLRSSSKSKNTKDDVNIDNLTLQVTNNLISNPGCLNKTNNSRFSINTNDINMSHDLNINNVLFGSSNNQNSFMNVTMCSESGSNSTFALLLNSNLNLTNTTQSTFMNSNLNKINKPLNNLSEIYFDDNEQKDFMKDTRVPDTDFIVSTNSNLELLKTHSFFNSMPLNYYPTLMTNIGKLKINNLFN
jgi:hypothetical protein